MCHCCPQEHGCDQDDSREGPGCQAPAGVSLPKIPCRCSVPMVRAEEFSHADNQRFAVPRVAYMKRKRKKDAELVSQRAEEMMTW